MYLAFDQRQEETVALLPSVLDRAARGEL